MEVINGSGGKWLACLSPDPPPSTPEPQLNDTYSVYLFSINVGKTVCLILCGTVS